MQPSLAILIDADNITASSAPAVFAHAATLGRPIIRRIFGRPTVIAGWIDAARTELYEFRPQPSVATAKNGTDIALAVDAMDILYSNAPEAYCIVSNDRDFVPLAIRLRGSGRNVHAVCRRADTRYAMAFDSVLELDARHSSPIVDAFRKIAAGRGPELTLGEAGKLLRQHLPGVIPTSGKAPLRRALENTGRFSFSGTGAGIRVRLIA